MKKHTTMLSLAAAVVCACGSAAGQDRQPIFEVDYEGPRGTNTLEAINFGAGLKFTKFIYASAVTNFEGDDDSRNYGQTRIVRGPDSDVGPVPMKARSPAIQTWPTTLSRSSWSASSRIPT